MPTRTPWMLISACAFAAAFSPSCFADQAMSPSQAHALQQRQYQASKEEVFGSVVDAFQDLGFSIDSADIQSGFVTAESATVNKTGFLDLLTSAAGSGNTKATAFIETMRAGVTRVRLTFLSTKTTSGAYGQGARQDSQILDERLFQRAFSRIDAAVLERMGTGNVAQADVTPIAALSSAQSATSSKSRAELLAAAKQELEAEGFQVLKEGLINAPILHLLDAASKA